MENVRVPEGAAKDGLPIRLRCRAALHGIRARLVLLALASMVPVFLFAAAVTLRYVEREQQAIRAHGLDLARLAADEVVQEIATVRGIVVGFSTTLALRPLGLNLGISMRTVDVHRSRIAEKLEVRGLPNLVRLALAAGVAHVR